MKRLGAVAALGSMALLLTVVSFTAVDTSVTVLDAPVQIPDSQIPDQTPVQPITDDVLADITTSMMAATAACSGPITDPSACSSFWTDDCIIYDMKPPTGAIRGRAEFEAKLRDAIKAKPQLTKHRREYIPRRAGSVGFATTLAWQTGLWREFTDAGKVLHVGRYSAIMRKESNVWKFYISAEIAVAERNDWITVKNGEGGRMIGLSQQILNSFTDGYNKEDYVAAFQNYAPDAVFPVMTHLGGDSISFAMSELKRQRTQLSPVMLEGRVDEVVLPISPGNNNVAVVHGIVRMLDQPAQLWLFARFSFLMVLARDDENSPWLVRYDFSPNFWLEPL